MVDRRTIAEGSTAASTGLLQYEIDTPLVELIGKVGRELAEAAYRASVASLEAFAPLVEQLGDDCGLRERQSLYLASSEKDARTFEAERDARRQIGIDVTLLSRPALADRFGISRPGALWSSRAMEVDPFRLTQCLVRRAIELGLEVFTETEITRYEVRGGHAVLHAAGGATIQAKKVVFAMGYETMGLIPADLCTLSSTYALISEPVSDLSAWKDQCLIWESARPYLYVRSAEGNRVIVGGEDEDVVDPHRRDRLIAAKVRKLCARFASLFPTIKIESTCAWAGTFAQTEDGLPYIGTLPKYPDAYFALGYGGNGITFSLIAAQIITNLFTGHPDSRTSLFAFDR
jgi:glycine/D-amino acid oxidase-like deaminating enzyme